MHLRFKIFPAFLVFFLFFSVAHAGTDKLFADLGERLAELEASQTLPVIVTYDENRTFIPSLLWSIPGDYGLTHAYSVIPALALTLDREQILWTADLASVERIDFDAPVEAFMETADYWSGTEDARYDFGPTGEGVTVAVIDTGIDAAHAAFEGKDIVFADFVNENTEPYDDHGHGTHCAGIIAGEYGVAPGADLVAVKVLNSKGSGNMSDIMKGIDWCIEYNLDAAKKIDIMSLSLGGALSAPSDDVCCLAIDRAVDEGILAVVAAGNSGPAAKTVGSPAAADKAITVGAHCDPGEGGFSLAYFSSRGPTADNKTKPDITAPGYKINAPEAGAGYVEMSGTSMACPFAAGTAALMLSVAPNSPETIKNIMCDTARDWGRAGKDNDYGAGMLDGYSAIEACSATTGNNIELPAHLAASDDLGGRVSWLWWFFNSPDTWKFEVEETDLPVAVTMIIEDWTSFLFIFSSHDLNMRVLDPAGKEIASATGLKRQETLSFKPQVTGTYTLEVTSIKGKRSDYFIDMSGDISGLKLTADN